MCDSEFSRDDLVAFGIPSERLSVLHLPASTRQVHRSPSRDVVRLLFVGRMVPIEGVLDLIEALGRLHDAGTRGFTLTLAGNALLSSPGYAAQASALITARGMDAIVELVDLPDEAELSALYAASDALVMPSYHEGYCLPVIEALAAGCYVIAYDLTNVPHVVGGLGTLITTGDIEGLTSAIADFVGRLQTSRARSEPVRLPTARGDMGVAEWRAAVGRHLAEYSESAFLRGFAALIRAIAAGMGWPGCGSGTAHIAYTERRG